MVRRRRAAFPRDGSVPSAVVEDPPEVLDAPPAGDTAIVPGTTADRLVTEDVMESASLPGDRTVFRMSPGWGDRRVRPAWGWA
ncbi:hypothetical protein GCM10010266_65140 [Streptomyces griseomycini]|nr:hypothetical protein GCM10010266_65140 [Streptomyces griseomycini]GGR36368.1 hypothetical protein GCM10015536_47730 [Streptomyces griseomycini]